MGTLPLTAGVAVRVPELPYTQRYTEARCMTSSLGQWTSLKGHARPHVHTPNTPLRLLKPSHGLGGNHSAHGRAGRGVRVGGGLRLGAALGCLLVLASSGTEPEDDCRQDDGEMDNSKVSNKLPMLIPSMLESVRASQRAEATAQQQKEKSTADDPPIEELLEVEPPRSLWARLLELGWQALRTIQLAVLFTPVALTAPFAWLVDSESVRDTWFDLLVRVLQYCGPCFIKFG